MIATRRTACRFLALFLTAQLPFLGIPQALASPTETGEDQPGFGGLTLFGESGPEVTAGATETPTQKTASTKTYVGSNPADFIAYNQLELARENPSACGPTSLSMIMATLGMIEPTLEAAREVDQEIRPAGEWTVPQNMIGYAERHGLNASSINGATFEELKACLAAGNMVQANVASSTTGHWVVVVGVETDPATGREYVIIADPMDQTRGTRTLSSRRVTRQAFEAVWNHPLENESKFGSNFTDWRNYLIIYDRDGDNLPRSRDFQVQFAENGGGAFLEVQNGWANIKRGKVGTGWSQMNSALVKGVTAIPAALGRIVEMGGDTLLDEGAARYEEGGIWNTVVGTGAYATGGLLKATGWCAKTTGNAVAWIGEKTGEGIKSIGRGIDAIVGDIASLF